MPGSPRLLAEGCDSSCRVVSGSSPEQASPQARSTASCWKDGYLGHSLCRSCCTPTSRSFGGPRDPSPTRWVLHTSQAVILDLPHFPTAAAGLTGAHPPRGERGDTAMYRRVVRPARLPVSDHEASGQADARASSRAAGHGFDQPQRSREHQENAPSSIGRRKERRKALRWSGRSQKTPGSVIQAFHFCGTISICY